jgi:uridine monophosphate synthetase
MTKQLILDLFENNMIKFGEFTLKSGKQSYIYADIRSAISYPKLFRKICDEYYKLMHGLKYDHICGVPYSALTFASGLAYEYQIPMLLKRKEAKSYGTKKLLEGVFTAGHTCLVIEDVVTTGSSLMETVQVLEEAGLKTTDLCTLIDRSQGGRELLTNNGYNLHSIMDLKQIIDVLYEAQKITLDDKNKALQCMSN